MCGATCHENKGDANRNHLNDVPSERLAYDAHEKQGTDQAREQETQQLSRCDPFTAIRPQASFENEPRHETCRQVCGLGCVHCSVWVRLAPSAMVRLSHSQPLSRPTTG